MKKLSRCLIALFGLNLVCAVAGNLGISSAVAEVIEGEVCYKVARDESTADKRTEVGVEDEGAGKRQLRLNTNKAFLVCDRALIDLEVLRSLQPVVTQGAGEGEGEVESGGTSAAPATGPGSGTGTGGGGGGGGAGGGGDSSSSSTPTTGDGAQSIVAGAEEESAQALDSPNNNEIGAANVLGEESCQVKDPSPCDTLPENGIVTDNAPTLCLADTDNMSLCPPDSEGHRYQCVIVEPGTYTYKFVHVLNGGKLFFKDDGPDGKTTEFLASSILVEQGGSVEAGTAECPFGSNNGQLTIGLWGAAPTTPGQVPPGSPISCLSNNGKCYPAGYESGHYCTVAGSSDPCSATEKPAIGDNALFESYQPLPNDGGAIFGYKVFAVSYGGNVQLFGRKGVKTDAATPPNTCPTPANQFNVQDWADLTDSSWARLSGTFINNTQLKLDRQVDWIGGDPGKGDKIVVSTTDWHASHSELVEIMKNDTVPLAVCAGGPNAGSQCTKSPPNQCPASTCSGQKQVSQLTLQWALDYRHRFQLLPVPADLSNATMNPNTQVDLRAAVGLLSRDIAIISKGPIAAATDNFPKPSDCKTDKADCYFGGHFIVRQGFKNVQLRGVEFRQLGQGANLGHYPVHFHLAKSTAYTTPLIEDNSIWDSMTRFVVLHGTHDVPVSRNVGYLSMGHGYYLEDGSEINNLLCQNLAVSTRGSLKEYFDAQPSESLTARYIPPILDGSRQPGFCENDKATSCVINDQCGGSSCGGICIGQGKNPPFCVDDNGCDSGHKCSFGTEQIQIHGSDSFFPVSFWAMNAYNEFVGNMAAGVHGFGSCYWLLGSGVSGPSFTRLHWTENSNSEQDYANFNATGSRQAPLKRFRNNACTTAAYALQTTLTVPPTSKGTAGYQAATSPYKLKKEMYPLVHGNFNPVKYGDTWANVPDRGTTPAEKNAIASTMVKASRKDPECANDHSSLEMPDNIFSHVQSFIGFQADGRGKVNLQGGKNIGVFTVVERPPGKDKFCVTELLEDEETGSAVTLIGQSQIATVGACAQGLSVDNDPLHWATNAQHCVATVIDRFTTSFNWSEVGFGSVWLRPQFYLFLNSSITDQLTGGLGFVSGGGWAQAPPGYFTITKNSIFAGSSRVTPPGRPVASGPTGPLLTKKHAMDNCQDGLCLFPEDGTALFKGGLNPKRLITIYDGPSYSQGSVFLKTGTIRDDTDKKGCRAVMPTGDDDPLACGIYQFTMQPYQETATKDRMYVEDAGIGWKQPNGFYYPPAFAYADTAFENWNDNEKQNCFSLVRDPEGDPEGVLTTATRDQVCRHNVLDQYVEYVEGNLTDTELTPKLLNNITPIDFGTILNDLDGTLTGWVPEKEGASPRTSSVSRNNFFDAPSQDAECNSFGTMTTPFELLTTVVSKLNHPPDTEKNSVDFDSWNNPGAFPAVPIYRQQRMGGKANKKEECYSVCGACSNSPVDEPISCSANTDCATGTTCDFERWGCNRATFMAGAQMGAAPYLTMNNGVYYIDTNLPPGQQNHLQCVAGATGTWHTPRFESESTYVIYNLFATQETNIKYQVYVGDGFNLEMDGKFVRVKPHVHDGPGNNLSVVPCKDCGDSLPAKSFTAKHNAHATGVLDLAFNYAGSESIKKDFSFEERNEDEKCLPRDICKISGGECVRQDKGFKEPHLEETVDEICKFWVRATAGTTDFPTNPPTPTSFADCPEGGCVGYAFTVKSLDPKNDYHTIGEAAATDNDMTACFDPNIFKKPMTSVDKQCPDPAPPVDGNFCGGSSIGG